MKVREWIEKNQDKIPKNGDIEYRRLIFLTVLSIDKQSKLIFTNPIWKGKDECPRVYCLGWIPKTKEYKEALEGFYDWEVVKYDDQAKELLIEAPKEITTVRF